VEAHRPRRVFIDGLTDIQRLITTQQRLPAFISALTNELRARGATTLLAAEIDAYVDTHLAAPIPSVSATMDNGILLRHVEVRSELRRLISVLKARQAATDPTIREFTIGKQGLVVSRPFAVTSGLLTGRASSSDPAILDS
jgi:circadian clock protein KaiC